MAAQLLPHFPLIESIELPAGTTADQMHSPGSSEAQLTSTATALEPSQIEPAIDDEAAEADEDEHNGIEFLKKLGLMAVCIVAYSAIGGAVFLGLEAPVQTDRLDNQQRLLRESRDALVDELLLLVQAALEHDQSVLLERNITETVSLPPPNRTDAVMEYFASSSNTTTAANLTTAVNASEPVVWVERLVGTELLVLNASGHNTSLRAHLQQAADGLVRRGLRVKRCYNELPWDFYNAWLYACTLITTIGYGHIAPETNWGRVATMLYALVGIPLMLVCLSDLGVFLTQIMKFPFFACKFVFRRCFRCCLGLTLEEIRKIEQQDRLNLKVFDLPIPVAVGIVVGWTFVCAAVQMIWERDWDYLVAFYFFFISLTTIGLGDIAPSQPHYLLMMFLNIVVGLSLLSMCINLISMRVQKAAAGRRQNQQQAERNRKKQSAATIKSKYSKYSKATLKGWRAEQMSVNTTSEETECTSENTTKRSEIFLTGKPPKPPSAVVKKQTMVTLQQSKRQSRIHSSHSNIKTELCQPAGQRQQAPLASPSASRSSSNDNLNDSFYDNHHLAQRVEQQQQLLLDSPESAPDTTSSVAAVESIVVDTTAAAAAGRRQSDSTMKRWDPVKEVFI